MLIKHIVTYLSKYPEQWVTRDSIVEYFIRKGYPTDDIYEALKELDYSVRIGSRYERNVKQYRFYVMEATVIQERKQAISWFNSL
jgi:hypothetical protein